MAIISEKHGFIFIMSPRTGCTALAYGVLVPELAGERVPFHDILDDNGNMIVDSKHSTLSDLIDHGLIRRERAKRLFKFCSVRNPFDSLFSLYVKQTTSYRRLLEDKNSFIYKKPGALEDLKRAQDLSFSEWVVARFTGPVSWRRPERLLRRGRGRPKHMYGPFIKGMDHIMRFERLQEDFDETLERLGISQRFEIPRMGVTEERDGDYRPHYSPEARAIAEYIFKPDMRRFGYRF